jgi:hypothetical protein
VRALRSVQSKAKQSKHNTTSTQRTAAAERHVVGVGPGHELVVGAQVEQHVERLVCFVRRAVAEEKAARREEMRREKRERRDENTATRQSSSLDVAFAVRVARTWSWFSGRVMASVLAFCLPLGSVSCALPTPACSLRRVSSASSCVAAARGGVTR